MPVPDRSPRLRTSAPHDRIIVTAGGWDLPPAWREQLVNGGRLVVPLHSRPSPRGAPDDQLSEGQVIDKRQVRLSVSWA